MVGYYANGTLYKHGTKYVVEDAIDKIMATPIPDTYQDDDERAAFADGQGEAIMILRECLKEAADDQS